MNKNIVNIDAFLKRCGIHCPNLHTKELVLAELSHAHHHARMLYIPDEDCVALSIQHQQQYVELWREDVQQEFYKTATPQDLKRILREEIDAFLGDPDLD